MGNIKPIDPKFDFIYNSKLDLKEPVLYVPVDELSTEELSAYFFEANKIAAEIPAKILKLDEEYMQKHDQLSDEEEQFFARIEELNAISEKICELNVLYLKIEGHFIQTDTAL